MFLKFQLSIKPEIYNAIKFQANLMILKLKTVVFIHKLGLVHNKLEVINFAKFPTSRVVNKFMIISLRIW